MLTLCQETLVGRENSSSTASSRRLLIILRTSRTAQLASREKSRKDFNFSPPPVSNRRARRK